uniref:Uncharacterized protein n=1 Tax=Arundo donax TaxID=35708 RepID=A0A0A9A9H9_ARUDO
MQDLMVMALTQKHTLATVVHGPTIHCHTNNNK